ncbi:MAG: WD40/YVTN/BNR-like repeat-containing protein [Actinomycetota bacterium]
MTRLLIGTTEGFFELDDDEPRPGPGFGEREVTALAVDAGVTWAVAQSRSLMRREGSGAWEEIARSEDLEIACLVRTPTDLFVGTDEARVLRLRDGDLVGVESFDRVEGREKWYTPWGGPPAVRSLAVDLAGRIHANVHVGGIPRSLDGGETWEPTIDIDADVHQVIAHPSEPDVVLAAGAVGLAISEDGGASWRIEREGLRSTYARAVAVAGDAILLTASDGHRGGHAAIYRTTLGPGLRLEKCTEGLPEWFDGNIDTGWLAAAGSIAAFATNEGRVFASDDAGATWRQGAAGLPRIRWLCFA